MAVSCQRRPSNNSLTSKWVENVSKLTGRPQPEELRVGHRGTRRAAFADRAHAPRAVTRSPRLARLEVVHLAVDLDPALPSAELGEAGVVEHHPHAHLLEEVRLLDRCRPADEGEVRPKSLLRGVDLEPERMERLEHLDLDRADLVGVRAVGRCASRRVHVDLPAVDAPRRPRR